MTTYPTLKLFEEKQWAGTANQAKLELETVDNFLAYIAVAQAAGQDLPLETVMVELISQFEPGAIAINGQLRGKVGQAERVYCKINRVHAHFP